MSRPTRKRAVHASRARAGGSRTRPDTSSADGQSLRLSDLAYERLKREIVRCVLAPGAEVTERELVTRYRTGKAAVRAALIQLRQDGLVRALPRRGYSVNAVTTRGVTDLFEMRALLEPGVARLATGRVDGARLERLRDLCTAPYTTGDRDSEEAFLRANREFHVLLAEATGNERLAGAIADLLDATERLVYLGLGMEGSMAALLREHQALLDAIVRGDADGAAEIARAHVEGTRKVVFDAIFSHRRGHGVGI